MVIILNNSADKTTTVRLTELETTIIKIAVSVYDKQMTRHIPEYNNSLLCSIIGSLADELGNLKGVPIRAISNACRISDIKRSPGALALFDAHKVSDEKDKGVE